jgi:hypothetical protein
MTASKGSHAVATRQNRGHGFKFVDEEGNYETFHDDKYVIAKTIQGTLFTRISSEELEPLPTAWINGIDYEVTNVLSPERRYEAKAYRFRGAEKKDHQYRRRNYYRYTKKASFCCSIIFNDRTYAITRQDQCHQDHAVNRYGASGEAIVCKADISRYGFEFPPLHSAQPPFLARWMQKVPPAINALLCISSGKTNGEPAMSWARNYLNRLLQDRLSKCISTCFQVNPDLHLNFENEDDFVRMPTVFWIDLLRLAPWSLGFLCAYPRSAASFKVIQSRISSVFQSLASLYRLATRCFRANESGMEGWIGHMDGCQSSVWKIDDLHAIIRRERECLAEKIRALLPWTEIARREHKRLRQREKRHQIQGNKRVARPTL